MLWCCVSISAAGTNGQLNASHYNANNNGYITNVIREDSQTLVQADNHITHKPWNTILRTEQNNSSQWHTEPVCVSVQDERFICCCGHQPLFLIIHRNQIKHRNLSARLKRSQAVGSCLFVNNLLRVNRNTQFHVFFTLVTKIKFFQTTQKRRWKVCGKRCFSDI